MSRIAVLAFALVISSPAYAQKGRPDIRLPGAPTLPDPPSPSVQKLTADVWYVIDSDVECLVLCSPAGMVSSSHETGPVKVRGRFVDGSGKTETRTYSGKHVFTLEAAQTGRCEILIVPAGAKEDGVIRRTLDVVAGEAPRPPPDPKPPEPKPPEPPAPKPKPDPVSGPLWVVVVEETSDAATNRGAFFADAGLMAHMKAKGYKWRVMDKDVKDKDGRVPKDLGGYLDRAAGKKLPYLMVVDADALIHREGPLPATPADLVKLLKEVSP